MHGNLQARIGLNFVNDCVVTLNHFLDGSSAAGCFELTQLIEVERDKLFNLEDVQSVPIRLSPKATRCRVLPFSGVKFIVGWGDGAPSYPEQ